MNTQDKSPKNLPDGATLPTKKDAGAATQMQALIYAAKGQIKLQACPKPVLLEAGDAIVRVTQTTICGTDLHILKGDVPTAQPGRILGHEGVRVIESVGAAVTSFKPGDHVLISCVSACGTCEFFR
jgi:alcohol dehydrogenase